MFELFAAVLTLSFLSDEGGTAGRSRAALEALLGVAEREQSDRYTFYVLFQLEPNAMDSGWYFLNQRVRWKSGLMERLDELGEIAEHAPRSEVEAAWAAHTELEGRVEDLDFVGLGSEEQRDTVLEQIRNDIEPEAYSLWVNRFDPEYRWLKGWIPSLTCPSQGGIDGSYLVAGAITISGQPDWLTLPDDELLALLGDQLRKDMDHVGGFAVVVGVARPGRSWRPNLDWVNEISSRRLLGLPIRKMWGAAWSASEWDPDSVNEAFRVATERWAKVYEEAGGEWLPADLPRPRPSEI